MCLKMGGGQTVLRKDKSRNGDEQPRMGRCCVQGKEPGEGEYPRLTTPHFDPIRRLIRNQPHTILTVGPNSSLHDSINVAHTRRK